jgi:hypothetical protein
MIELAGALPIQNHVERRAIFHRAAGIEKLGLAENLDSGKCTRSFFQTDQRRVPDGGEQGFGLRANRSEAGDDVRHQYFLDSSLVRSDA